MRHGGYETLIQETYPENVSIKGKNCFLGMSFSHKAVPIDVVGLLLAGKDTESYSILLVDEFLRFNGAPEKDIKGGLKRIKNTLKVLGELYGVKHDVLLTSDFMKSDEYAQILGTVENRIETYGSSDKLFKTVPQHKSKYNDAIKYPLNEIACVEFLKNKCGMDVKIGPAREKAYDEIMQDMNLGIDFAYTIDAYSLGANAAPVVPYTVTFHPKKGQGHRIFLEDPAITAKNKLNLGGSDKALGYFVTLASAAGAQLGKTYLTDKEISALGRQELKEAATELVLNNIINPYKEAIKNENN